MKYILMLTLMASITQYAATGNRNAAGLWPQVGDVACPRSIKLGTKVEIGGKTYTCRDRTARWVEKKFPNTFDIYSEGTRTEMLKWGRRNMKIKIK